jgi:16S rRNA (cytosine1402-N4)-methyltransferase
MQSIHLPVLLHEVIENMRYTPGMVAVDATMNGGGHAREIIKRIMPSGMFIGIDWDKEVLEQTESQIRTECASYDQSQLRFVWSNYARIAEVLKNEKIPAVDAILADLGFSSLQIEDARRGLSFLREGPLDMRYDIHSDKLPAYEIINSFSKEALADIMYVYGEERYARKIAQQIVEQRKKERIYTTRELAELIEHMVPRRHTKGIHPATRVFQALRIYVNGEFENIKKLLADGIQVLAPKGRMGIISFHSLEDRIVKQTFKLWEEEGIARVITKKPIISTDEEVNKNPRSRSAKFRIAEKI